MSYLSQLSTEISDTSFIAEEIQEYIKKIKQLEIENEEISRQFRESNNLHTLILEECKLENEFLKKKIFSIEEFVEKMKHPEKTNFEGLANRIVELESNLVRMNHNEQNLLRQIATQNKEIFELKIKNSLTDFNLCNYSPPFDINFEDADSNDNNFLEINKLKNELHKLRESSILIITNKELANIELRNELENYKNNENKEIAKLLMEIDELKSGLKLNTKNDEDPLILTLTEQNELIDKYSRLEDENERLQKIIFSKEMLLEEEKQRSESLISNLQKENDRLSNEIQIQMERYQNDLNLNFISNTENIGDDSSNENKLLLKEIERLHSVIFQNEELIQQNEFKNQERINLLNLDIKSLQNQISILKGENEILQKYILELKSDSQNNKLKINEVNQELENTKLEIEQLKENIEKSENHIVKLKYENKNLKDNLETLTVDYNNIQEQINRLNEVNIENRTKFEKKFLEIESKYNDELQKCTNVELEQGDSLSDLLEENKINKDVIALRLKVNELENVIFKQKKDISDLNYAKNEEIKNLKVSIAIYENQVLELQKKEIALNDEIQSSKCKMITNSDTNQDFKKIDSDYLLIENSFLSEKIKILNDEIVKIKHIHEKGIQLMKKEIEITDQATAKAKIMLANLSFEKETEVIKLKNTIRKLKLKFNVTQNPQKKSKP